MDGGNGQNIYPLAYLWWEVYEGGCTVETESLEDLPALVEVHQAEEHLVGVELRIPANWPGYKVCFLLSIKRH